MIVADANVWIDFLRAGEAELQRLLDKNQVAMHPCLAAELALGSLHGRSQILAQLDTMPQVRVASLREIREMIEARQLYSRGIGLTDAHLIASCLMTPGTKLWTRDKALGRVAEALGVRAKLP